MPRLATLNKRRTTVVAVFIGVGLYLFFDERFKARIRAQKSFDGIALGVKLALLSGNLNFFEFS